MNASVAALASDAASGTMALWSSVASSASQAERAAHVLAASAAADMAQTSGTGSAGTLTAFDYVVIVVIVLSLLRGAWRGLLSEVFGLIGWVAALILGARYADKLMPWVPSNWPGGGLTQWLVAFVVVAIAVVVLASVASALLERLVDVSGLRSVDRSLGAMFGLARGMLLVLVLYVLAGLTELPHQAFWRDALLRPYVEEGVAAFKPYLPASLSAYVRV